SERERAGTGLHQERISVTMVAAVKLDDFVPFGKAAGHANGGHCGLGSRIAHTNLLHARHPGADQLRHFDFERVWDSKTRAVFGGFLDRLDDFWRRVA